MANYSNHPGSAGPVTAEHRQKLSDAAKARTSHRVLYVWHRIVDDRGGDEETFMMLVPGGRLFRHRTGGGCNPSWTETMCFAYDAGLGS